MEKNKSNHKTFIGFIKSITSFLLLVDHIQKVGGGGGGYFVLIKADIYIHHSPTWIIDYHY